MKSPSLFPSLRSIGRRGGRPAAAPEDSAPPRPRPGPAKAWLRAVPALAAAIALLAAWRAHAPWWVAAGLLALGVALLLRELRRGRGLTLLGPLFFYDMARLARRGRTTALRCSYAVALLVWLGLKLIDRFPSLPERVFREGAVLSISDWAAFARTSVVAILSLQSAAVLVLTPAYLAGALAEEKERRTLEMLFTTDLLDREIVLGKLFGRLLHLATILLTALPVLCLTRLWGGVESDTLLAGFAVAAFSLLSVGGLSLLCSVVARTVLGAVVSSYALVFLLNLFCLALPATSPLVLVPTWDSRVDAAWKDWQDMTLASIPVSGPPVPGSAIAAIPPPDPTAMLLEMLAPYAVVHSMIFLICTIAAVRLVRECCLAPGEVAFRGPAPEAERVSSWGPTDWSTLEDRRPPPLHAVYRPVPVSEPALLWKEMYHGLAAAPGPSPREWLLPRWRKLLALAAGLAGASVLLALLTPAWPTAVAALNVPLRIFTVLLAGVWCLLVAFRSAGGITRERERRTLESLLTLPGDPEEILRAKWLGSILRYRQLGYALAAAWVLGLVLGALHPWAVLFLVVACGVHLAFLASAGLWLSLASRNTLWANMSMALVLLLLFTGSWLGWSLADTPEEVGAGGWLGVVLHARLDPVFAWWTLAFSWQDLSTALLQADRPFLRSLAEAAAAVLLFAAGAAVFWRLARHRFRLQLRERKRGGVDR